MTTQDAAPMRVATPAELVQAFERLSMEARVRARSFSQSRDRALYGLMLARDSGYRQVTLKALSASLDAIGISLTVLQLRNTLGPAVKRRLVSRRNVHGHIVFALTQDGEAALEAAGSGRLTILAVVGDRPLKARSDIEGVISSQVGTLRITDPYFGRNTAYLLAHARSAREVRFLTARCGGGESQGAAEAALLDWMDEVGNAEVRKVAQPQDIAHDRCVLSDGELVLVGHGFKDIGRRDSFVVRLPRDLLGGISDEIERRFDRLWATSIPLRR